MQKPKTNSLSRRRFIQASALGIAGVMVDKNIMFAASNKNTRLKVALLGCGGRGNGALKNCIEAGKHTGIELQVTAAADYFKDRVLKTAEKYNIPESRCFAGANAYKDLFELDFDVLVTATPPAFRPVHVEAAIKAGKHVFMEKPVAVDPPGARKIIQAGELAGQKGLSIVAGTQRRHQRAYLENAWAVKHGAIGPIRGGCVWWCGGALWHKTQKPGETDADYMIRNWVSFAEMSGDHIVEQHVHNLDVANWFIGHAPVRAIGFGSRTRRKTGNQFDFFSVEFDYAKDIHIHSMCRQINGCYTRVSEQLTGSTGSIWCGSSIKSNTKLDIPDFSHLHKNPYVQEHIDLLNSIVKHEPINEARNVAESTLTGIMGRISAYTGQLVQWSDLTTNKKSPWYDLTLKPTALDFETGQVTAPSDDIAPVPGRDKKQKIQA